MIGVVMVIGVLELSISMMMEVLKLMVIQVIGIKTIKHLICQQVFVLVKS